MCKWANGRFLLLRLWKSASKGDHLHIYTFAHLHIKQAFAH